MKFTGKLLSLLLCLSLLLGLLFAMAVTTAAAEPANAVRYLDESGKECYVTEFTTVTSATTTLSDGWYAVKGTVLLESKITVSGTVHLILCDKATLSVPGVQLSKDNSLTIYAQSRDINTMGSLISTSETLGQAAIGGYKGGSGTLVINGGVISATSTQSFSAAIGCGSSSAYASAYSCDPITINGGVVTASSSANAAAIGGSMNSPGCTVVVNGGIVTATAGRNGSGIGGGREGGGGNFTQNGGIVLANCGHSDISYHAIPIGNGANSRTPGTATYHGGITFLSGVGKLNSDSFTLDQEFSLPADATLTVESGKTLTVAEGGYIAIAGTLDNQGTIVNNGGILNGGTFTNSGSGSCGLYAKAHPVVAGADSCAFCGSGAAPKLSGGVYYVSSADHMYWLAEQINGGSITGALNIELVNDITISSDRTWTPIAQANGQSSVFEGNGHTITLNLESATASSGGYGLFSNLNYSTVRNLVLEGSVTVNSTDNVGALAASAYRTTFENVVSLVDVTNTCTTGGYAGGLVGYFGGKHDAANSQYSKLVNCAVYADVVGYHAGGLIGHSWNGTQYYDMTNCLYMGNVTANGGAAGAIVGYQETDSNTCTFTNVFWNEPDGLGFYGRRDTENQVYHNTVSRTAEDFASGAIAWELNGGVTDGSQIWYQLLDEDDYPLLSGPTVYRGYNHICTDTEPIYSNASGYLRDTPADHTYETGCSTTCMYCGAERTTDIEHTVEEGQDANQHWKYCTVCGVTWDVGDHDIRCQDNEDGTHTYSCSICGYVQKTEYHNFEDQDLGDGTHITQCSCCLLTKGEPVAHTLVTSDTGEGSHITHCEACSYTEQYSEIHSMVYEEQEGGTHKYYCTECDYVEKITGHDIIVVDNGDGTHTVKCAYCTYVDSTAAHLFEYGVCCFCGCVELSEPAQVDGVYQISNTSELYWFAQLVNGGTADASAELVNDIVVNRDIADESQTYRLAIWTPIGAEVEFTGSFNGNYHTISGLYAKGSAETLGFIGNLDGGTVSKVGIINSYFETDINNCYVGGVVASNYGTVSQCWFDGTVIIHGPDAYCGGVVGYNGYEKLTENCYNLGDVICNYDGSSGGITTVGGVVGHNFAGTVRSCYNAGTVTENYPSYAPSRVGTLIGCNFGFDYTSMGMGTGYATTENCYTLYSDTDSYGYRSTQYSTTDISEVSEESLTNGALTWMLNGWSSEGIWKQTLDEDLYPVFDGKTVYYDEENGDYYNEIVVIPGVPTKVRIKISHSVSFDSDLQMNYRIKLEDILAVVPNFVTEGAYLEVEKSCYPVGGGIVTADTSVLLPDLTTDPTRMIFRLPDIQSVEMGSELRAELRFYDSEGNKYYTVLDVYSVLDYAELCFDYYDPAENAELFTMLIDALNYGSAAQVYFDRRADELVNAGMDAYQQYATTELSAPLEDSKVTETNDRSITAVSEIGFSVTFADKTELNAKLTLAEGYSKEDITSVKVLDAEGKVLDTLTDFTELDDGRLQVTYYGIKSVQMRERYYFVAYVGDEVASDSVGYSVEAYAKSSIASTDTKLADMVLKCIYYGDSAKSYFESRSK